MSDLIEREAVLDAICGFCKFETDAERRKACTNCLDVKKIKAMPSARPKGEWISIIEVNDFGETYQAGIYCSECGETFGHETNFCPYCGADMRESRERRE